MGKISIFRNVLLGMGFIPVIGTYEITPTDESKEVGAFPEFANCWGKNQGLTVVYDHLGHAYLRFEDLTARERYLLNLKVEDRNDSIYVPHSNDGLAWAAENLLDRRERMDPSIM